MCHTNQCVIRWDTFQRSVSAQIGHFMGAGSMKNTSPSSLALKAAAAGPKFNVGRTRMDGGDCTEQSNCTEQSLWTGQSGATLRLEDLGDATCTTVPVSSAQ